VVDKLQHVISDVARAISSERTIAIITAANNPDLHSSINQAVQQLDLDQSVSILDPSETKGLEFDEVIIIEPEDIVYRAVQGFQDLYVAATRATQGLTVTYSGQPMFESA
ncbi:MAG: helicase, partial [Corynebacterium kroppenstedtii]|nr:helicase [Corynebacterium kroppenstedtii]